MEDDGLLFRQHVCLELLNMVAGVGNLESLFRFCEDGAFEWLPDRNGKMCEVSWDEI